MKRLQTIQKALAHAVTKTPKHHHMTPVLKSPHWPITTKSPSMLPLQYSISYLQYSSNLSTLLHSLTSPHPTTWVHSLIIISFPILPPSLILSQVLQLVLGVEISSDLGMSAHIDQVLASCASSMYALRVLRCHGLPPPQLDEVARATTIASLMYASPSWWGFSSAKD